MHGNYQSISDMPGPPTKFYVHEAGYTKQASRKFVSKFSYISHTEVTDVEDSDYLLVFCPVVSRVGTDIKNALQNILVTDYRKPKILIVMHHTFNGELVVAESRRQVDPQHDLLVVDTLFYNGEFLSCRRNDIAWHQIKQFLGATEIPWWRKIIIICQSSWSNRKMIGFLVFGAVALWYFWPSSDESLEKYHN